MTPAVELDRIQGTLVPTGYRVLVRIPKLEAQMKQWSNLVRPEENRRLEEIAQLTGQVIALGPDAYRDSGKFPSGPWCKPGDMIVMRAYSGTRFNLRSVETGEETLYCLINDDSVQAVISGGDEEVIERV